jgi:hypothetical protein
LTSDALKQVAVAWFAWSDCRESRFKFRERLVSFMQSKPRFGLIGPVTSETAAGEDRLNLGGEVDFVVCGFCLLGSERLGRVSDDEVSEQKHTAYSQRYVLAR